MRTKTLNALCLLLAFGAVLTLQRLAGPGGIKIPFLGRSIAAHLLVLILSPIIYVAFYALNRYILRWRLEHGRDIVEEEKYESETGFISLKPKEAQQEQNGQGEGFKRSERSNQDG